MSGPSDDYDNHHCYSVYGWLFREFCLFCCKLAHIDLTSIISFDYVHFTKLAHHFELSHAHGPYNFIVQRFNIVEPIDPYIGYSHFDPFAIVLHVCYVQSEFFANGVLSCIHSFLYCTLDPEYNYYVTFSALFFVVFKFCYAVGFCIIGDFEHIKFIFNRVESNDVVRPNVYPGFRLFSDSAELDNTNKLHTVIFQFIDTKSVGYHSELLSDFQ
ncbi:MAG: hypothetical protein Q9201_001164 [Fulgogasparrea decipioides]